MKELIKVKDISYHVNLSDYNLDNCGYCLDFKSNLGKEVADEKLISISCEQSGEKENDDIYEAVKEALRLIQIDTDCTNFEHFFNNAQKVIDNKAKFDIKMEEIIKHYQITEMDIELLHM